MVNATEREIGIRYIATSLALALTLTGCADGETGSTTATTAPATTTSTAATTTTRPAAPTTLDPSTTTAPPTVGEAQTDAFATSAFPGSGAPALLQEVRTETYDSFTRLVYEFETAIPEYRIEYLDGPVRASPSGQEVDLAGSEFLAITMAPAAGVDLSGDQPVVTYEGPDRIEIGAGAISQIQMVKTEDFESHLTWVLGLDRRLPFSFSTLDAPPRVVVDLHSQATS